MSLSDRLRDAMGSRTVVGLAEEAGLGPKGAHRIHELLRGRVKDPGASTLIAIARALGVSPDYLVFGVDFPEPDTIARLREDIIESTARWLRFLARLEQMQRLEPSPPVPEAARELERALRNATPEQVRQLAHEMARLEDEAAKAAGDLPREDTPAEPTATPARRPGRRKPAR